MKLTYIAGPYMAFDKQGIKDRTRIAENIRHAMDMAVYCANSGIPFVCPHLHTAHFDLWANAPEEFYKELDMELLKMCAAIIMLNGWTRSKGSNEEFAWAQEHGLHIFFEDSLDIAKIKAVLELS